MTAYQKFLEATKGLTPGQVESVKEGRFCLTPQMLIARMHYLDYEVSRMDVIVRSKQGMQVS